MGFQYTQAQGFRLGSWEGRTYSSDAPAPRSMLRLFLAFAVYTAAPVAAVPFIGLSWSAPLFYAVALEMLGLLRGWGIHREGRWLALASLLWAGMLFSFAVSTLTSDTAVPDLASVARLYQFAYWMLVFVLSVHLIRRGNVGPRLPAYLATAVVALAAIVLLERVVLGTMRPNGCSSLTRMTQNAYGWQFSTFSPFLLPLALAGRRRTHRLALMGPLMRICAGGRNVMLAMGEADHPPAPGVHWISATALTRNELQVTVPVRRAGLSNPPRLAFVGRLDPVKGLSNLVEAVAILAKQGHRPLPQIVLVGDGPQRRELGSRMDALGCQHLFHFTGHLDRCALSDVLRSADLCVQPSLSEGFSKVWLEAFAHGLPVLGTEVGAARRVIGRDGERGWLVPPGDAAALAARLRQVLTEPRDWSASGGAAARTRRTDCTLEAWAHEISRICAQQWDMRLVEWKLQA